jgi:AcrR family transcriptional regulator
MARKPPRRKPAKAARSTPAKPAARSGTPRERIIAAFMQLLAEKPFEEIGLADIAERAGVTLAQLRGEFDSPLAILAAHVKEIDRQVLDGGDADMAEETPRDRLFDVLMRRLEALTPYKAALRSLMRSALRNPGLALALNKLAVRSQQWMLTAAGIGVSGPKGVLRSQGLSHLAR